MVIFKTMFKNKLSYFWGEIKRIFAKGINSKKIRIIIKYVLLFFIFFLGCHYFFRNKIFYSYLYGTNKNIIEILSPFVFFSIIILYIVYKKRKADMGGLLTLLGVFIAILFFLIQNTKELEVAKYEEIIKLDSLGAANIHNCGFANSIASSSLYYESGEQFQLGSFITDVYADNINLFYKTYGKELGDNLLKSLAIMRTVNNLIEMVQGIEKESCQSNPENLGCMRSVVVMRNKDIIERAKDIKNIFCDKLINQN